ncbi:MAG TPA: 16S rRNA (cytosine(1402)-N(4))-methyltransferase RsmH [Cyclobacteriaceae bacterium]|nr:16S rRNA (cytosine(1402)-N(4))-methyltransferase RsmH [Cyclobacteriaceae bacterium]HRK55073.1 16S rRNA (cytosine(1402)-N(4))-methyltransferase RsmH [Cyclobacteriaceae bacterium]
MSEASYHRPVMLSECISALNIDPEGVYVDVTFGGGGHSLKILEKIKGGRLIAFDQDEDAKREAEKINHRSLTFCQANFMYMKRYLKLNQITKVDGILADLGISSHQIDSPDRGFSTRFDGPLDMRMDVQGPVIAANILNEYSEEQLHKIFGMYGELRNAKTAARVIVQTRLQKKFERNFDLLEVLKPIAPRGKDFKYYAQVFQALRIEVNKEMEALESFLMQCGEVMETGGRLVVMSYHSLEDRMVKNYINTGKVYGELEKDFYGNPIRPFAAINRKPITAGEEELEQNNRARSAKLRIAEKL